MTMGEQAVQRDAAQKPDEIDALVELLPKPLGTVIEVGSSQGGLAWVWHWLHASQIICVDNHPDLPVEKYPPSATIVHGDSSSLLVRQHLAALLGDQKVDVVFIDAAHDYVSVKKDWEVYRELVRPGGLVCFHDIVYHPGVPDCQVDRLWAEICDTCHQKSEIICQPAVWGGIGVVHC